MTGSENGWLEAAIAWEVCASLHRHYCKGKDALFTTRQSDFVKHAGDARDRASHGQASTQPVEKWSDRVQRAHPKSEPEFWPDELRLKYMAEEIADLRTAQPDTQVERLKQEIAWLEDAARESEYLRGYRQGYEQRDAEVRGALV